MNRQLLTLLIATGAAAGVAALFYPVLVDGAMRKRAGSIVASRQEKERRKRDVTDAAKRRKAIAESLSDVGAKNKTASLDDKIVRAGLTMSQTTFLLVCAGLGLFIGVALYELNEDVLIAGGGALVGAIGLPNWLLSFLAKRRVTKFIDGFPDAIEIIIRGVKAGLPVADCFRVIASEASEPLRSEFRLIVDSQTLGLSIGEAADRLAKRVPVPETSFFATVINIQQSAGGNLSEALANLSNVLRQRKTMKEKVKAISAEAKASAWIIGSLPFLVGGAVFYMAPDYMMILITTTSGKMILAGGLTWMTIGVIVMRSMINFDI